MREFISGLVEALSSTAVFGSVKGSIIQTPMNDMSTAGGFPLVSESYSRGEVARSSRFVEASEADFPAGDFRPPADCKKQDVGPNASGRRLRGAA